MGTVRAMSPPPRCHPGLEPRVRPGGPISISPHRRQVIETPTQPPPEKGEGRIGALLFHSKSMVLAPILPHPLSGSSPSQGEVRRGYLRCKNGHDPPVPAPCHTTQQSRWQPFARTGFAACTLPAYAETVGLIVPPGAIPSAKSGNCDQHPLSIAITSQKMT